MSEVTIGEQVKPSVSEAFVMSELVMRINEAAMVSEQNSCGERVNKATVVSA